MTSHRPITCSTKNWGFLPYISFILNINRGKLNKETLQVQVFWNLQNWHHISLIINDNITKNSRTIIKKPFITWELNEVLNFLSQKNSTFDKINKKCLSLFDSKSSIILSFNFQECNNCKATNLCSREKLFK